MRTFYSFCVVLVLFQVVFSCTRCTRSKTAHINASGKTLATRYLPPEGTVLLPAPHNSFAAYLRQLPLKAAGSQVHYYDGSVKGTTRVYDGVVDMEIGQRDLQQCADAVIRLRAEYLFAAKKYEQIHFNFTSGFRADYEKWRAGYRIQVVDDQATWIKTAQASGEHRVFRQYLDVVFGYAGTLSLSRELKKVKLSDMQTGDVLVHGALPGHAVIVVNMARDTVNGQQYFMLAESSTPAQEIQVLLNPMRSGRNVWYELDPGATQVVTADYVFGAEELRRF